MFCIKNFALGSLALQPQRHLRSLRRQMTSRQKHSLDIRS